MKFVRFICVTIFVFFISGCATIVSDSIYPVSISSSPEGVLFEIRNEDGMKVHSGRTPATITLDAHNGFFDGATYKVKFKKDGYYEQDSIIDSKLDGWYVANLLFGGFIGFLIVDPATGAMWKLPKYLSVSMPEKELSMKSEENGLRVLSINDFPIQYRDKLIPITN
jgi:hypothetical protein